MHLRVALSIAVGIVSIAASAADDAVPPEAFTLKEEAARTGTNIRSNVVTGGKLPLNRRWTELTDEQKAMVRSQFDGMPPDDEPPFPVNGLGPVYRDVQKVVEKVQTSDDMTLVVIVNASGEPTAVQVLKGSDQELIRHIASVLMLTKFKPGFCAGKACEMGYPFRIAAKIAL